MLLVRISDNGLIEYLNSAFLNEFSLERNDLISKPVEALNGHIPDVILDCLLKPLHESEMQYKVTSSSGKTWDLRKTTFSGGVDVVIQDVIQSEQLRHYIPL